METKRTTIRRTDLDRGGPRIWHQVLRISMQMWEDQLAKELVPKTDRDAMHSATEWTLAQNLVPFACIHADAHRAVERLIPELSQRWLQRCFPEGNPKGMSPPALPGFPEQRLTWGEVRHALEQNTLSMEDAALLLRFFGKPSLGTHESLVRRLFWIVPPKTSAWHPWVKEALWRLARKPICASVAKRTFHVVERDLQKLVPRCVENPHHRSGPPMRLYELAEVARIAANRPSRRNVQPPGA